MKKQFNGLIFDLIISFSVFFGFFNKIGILLGRNYPNGQVLKILCIGINGKESFAAVTTLDLVYFCF